MGKQKIYAILIILAAITNFLFFYKPKNRKGKETCEQIKVCGVIKNAKNGDDVGHIGTTITILRQDGSILYKVDAYTHIEGESRQTRFEASFEEMGEYTLHVENTKYKPLDKKISISTAKKIDAGILYLDPLDSTQ